VIKNIENSTNEIMFAKGKRTIIEQKRQ